MKLENGLAWGITFFILIAMTDIPLTAAIAAAFAWLIFVAVLLLYGPAAFDTITAFNKGGATGTMTVPTPLQGSGSGRITAK